ncbi:MAG TPA: hypothetical protein VGG19_16715 [Tepidisphaeraceae bacterium]|jgi:hypothetical protein
MAFQIIQIIYWLTLSTWFGGVLFFFILAPVIFKTIREANPVLPGVLSVNLESAHANLLAESILGNALALLGYVQIGAGIVLILIGIAQFFVIDLSDRNLLGAILRISLIVAATAIAAVDRFIFRPRLFRFRNEYVEHADDPDLAKTARENFDREYNRSEMTLRIIWVILLAVVLYSANIFPASVSLSRPAAAATP